MEQQTQLDSKVDFSGGLVTFQNLFAVPPNATLNCMDVKFGIGGEVEKRLGSTTLNATILVSSAATGFAPDSSGSLATGLQAFWKLDEAAGNRLDNFGSNTLTDNNATSSTAGILNNAAYLVLANSNWFEVADNATVGVGAMNNWTVALWVNLSSKTATRVFASKYNPASQQEFVLQYVSAPDRFQLEIEDTGGTAVSVNADTFGSPSTSTWYLLVAGRSSTFAYIQTNTFAVNSASIASVTPSRTTAPFRLGMNSASGIAFMDGSLDEAGVWNKVLSNQERIDLYNGGAANTYNKGASNSGWASFDFGAGFAGGLPLRWLTVAAGTGIYASSNRGTSFVVIATDRRADYQFFERSRSYLICCSNTYNQVLYWAGSANTFALALAVGSAPPAKHAFDFQGFLLLMNDSGGRQRVTYADNNKLTTDPWTTTFQIPSSFDDEITGGIAYNLAGYIFTKYTVFRLSAVGGNPDFAYRQVRSWGAVPGTIKKVTLQGAGEVIICLGWDRHVRVFDGVEDRIISTPVEQNNGISPVYLNGIPPEHLDKCRAEVDTEEQVYRLWIVMTPSTQTTHALCYNLRTNTWYPYANQGFNTAVMAESGNSRILTGVKRDGTVHWINTTNRDLTTAINEVYDSPLIFTTPRTVTKHQAITFYFGATSSGTIYVQDRTDFSSTFGTPRERIALTNTTSVLQIQRTVDVPLTQNVYQFRLTSSASTANPWRLTRVDMEGRDLGLGKA